MPTRQVITFARASVEIDERPGYLFVVESGQIRDVSEVRTYIQSMEKVIAKTGIDKAIIDARAEVGDPPAEVRAAMWDWLVGSPRGFSLVAFVLPSEMAVARVNMTALSRRAPVRAFDSVQQAQRWLVRGRRPTANGMAGADGEPARISSRPPPLRPDAEPRAETTRGFRAPAPGPIEHADGSVTERALPLERGVRSSEIRNTPSPGRDESSPPKKGNGGSQVA